jgi:tRNA (cytidine/uridine-2'-O-)-methyltransferase
MLHIVLIAPKIPSNTGNIIRLCANTGNQLHLIEPLGFTLDEPLLKRAGLDYHEYASINLHTSYESFCRHPGLGKQYLLTSKATTHYTQVAFKENDVLLFGNETDGCPRNISGQTSITHLTIPMQSKSRCLNLANSVAVVAYEALRQNHFASLISSASNQAPSSILESIAGT